MPISKTSGISLSEINLFLSKGNNISAYYDEFYLDTKRNTSKIFIPDRPINFGAFDNLAKLPTADVILPLVELTSQRGSGVYFKGDGADITLSVVLKAKKSSEPQPVLPFRPEQRPQSTVIKWYETTGGAFTEITSNVTQTMALPLSWALDGFMGSGRRPKQLEYIFRSMLKIPKDTTGTRTFVARAEVFTYNIDTDEVAGSAITTFDPYKITISEAGQPVITAHTEAAGQDSSGTIITYTNGLATSYPTLGVGFNYTFSEGSSPGWVETPDTRVESHVSYVSFNNGAFVASTASGVGPYGPFHRSHDPTKSPLEFGYWTRAPIKYTVPGEYRFKLISSISKTFTKPDGTTGYVITATDESIHTATIGSKTVDNAVPTLLSWTINEDSISEDGGIATATLSTQHAIGEEITLAASENFGSNLKIWKKQKITANSMTFKFTSKARNHGDNRTLTLYATPLGTWTDTTRVSDTVTLTNSGAPTLLHGYGMNGVNSVNEGSSFTYTLKGVNFQEEDYTWTTTFPAASVVATSGSFSTPYAGNYYTGNYHGTFTVDTVARTDHYEDVTGGQIKVYRNGTLYTQSGAKLKIKNTTAQPVTLPSSSGLAPIAHNKITRDTVSEPWYGLGSVSITLNKDSTWSSSSGQTGTYATPAPLEGDWIPVISEAGPIAKSTFQEDTVINIKPSGYFAFTQTFSQSSATLTVRGVAAQSIIGHGSCTFTYIFKNTVSKETRTGGVLNLSVFVHALPSRQIGIAVVNNFEGEQQIYGVVDEVVVVEETHPARGGLIRDYCGKNNIKWGAYHDGNGGHYARIIERNSVDCGYVSPYADSGIAPSETHEESIDVTTQSYAAGGSVTEEVNQNIYNHKLAEIDEQVRQQVIDDIAKNGLPDLTNVLAGITVDINKIKIDIGSINIGSI